MKRYVVKADGIVICRFFSKEKANRYAADYLEGCLMQDDPCDPKMEVVEEEIDDRRNYEWTAF